MKNIQDRSRSLFPYHFAWTLAALSCLPFMPLAGRRLRERLGLLTRPRVQATGNIWMHALSLGEVLSAVPLVGALGQRYRQRGIVFTATTVQGLETARGELRGLVSGPYAMPLDFWWAVRRFVRGVRPSLFLLVETDLWPGLVYHLRSKGVVTILVNGRISPRTFRSYRRFRPVTRVMLEGVERFLMQSDLDKERLLEIGVPREKVFTVGNIKFDRGWVPMGVEERNRWQETLKLQPSGPVWVAGSTHSGEEEIVLEAFGRLRSVYPDLRLILAPREVERSGDIFRTARSRGFKAVLRTDIANSNTPYDLLILNSLGELDRVYGLGRISFVGGSLVPVGGHNLLEPARFGQPVIFGPHTHNFVLMSELLLETGGGIKVENGDELYRAVQGLLSDPEKLDQAGRRARRFVESNRGALERVMEHIGSYLNKI